MLEKDSFFPIICFINKERKPKMLIPYLFSNQISKICQVKSSFPSVIPFERWSMNHVFLFKQYSINDILFRHAPVIPV